MYGFRVVFDHPYRDPGMSLGDCYLVGLTTSSFSHFGDRNGLLQSPHFWGIEDSGSYFVLQIGDKVELACRDL